MDSAAGPSNQMVGGAAIPSGQRAKTLTSEELMHLRARVQPSVIKLVRIKPGGQTYTDQGTIIAAAPAYCYVLALKRYADDCEIVIPTHGARFTMKKTDFITIDSQFVLAKIIHGSMTPVQLTKQPILFGDNVFLHVLHGEGLTPGSVVNPTGETKTGYFRIDNAPDFSAAHGAPVFDETGEFVGIVTMRPATCLVCGVSNLKNILRRSLPREIVQELRSLNVL